MYCALRSIFIEKIDSKILIITPNRYLIFLYCAKGCSFLLFNKDEIIHCVTMYQLLFVGKHLGNACLL